MQVGDEAWAKVIGVGGRCVIFDEGWACWEIRGGVVTDGRRNVFGG